MTESAEMYRFEVAASHTTVTLLPEMNSAELSDIDRIGSAVSEKLNSAKSPALVVDLTPLDYMGSSMVALIVRCWKVVNARGGRMAVVNQHEMVREILTIAGLHKLWTIVPTYDEALAEVRSSSTSGASADGGGGGGLMLTLFGLLLAAGAVAGACIALFQPKLLDPPIVMGIEFGCSVLGLMAGMVITVRGSGFRRLLGVVVVLVCLGAMSVGIWNLAGIKPPPPSAEAPEVDELPGLNSPPPE